MGTLGSLSCLRAARRVSWAANRSQGASCGRCGLVLPIWLQERRKRLLYVPRRFVSLAPVPSELRWLLSWLATESKSSDYSIPIFSSPATLCAGRWGRTLGGGRRWRPWMPSSRANTPIAMSIASSINSGRSHRNIHSEMNGLWLMQPREPTWSSTPLQLTGTWRSFTTSLRSVDFLSSRCTLRLQSLEASWCSMVRKAVVPLAFFALGRTARFPSPQASVMKAGSSNRPVALSEPLQACPTISKKSRYMAFGSLQACSPAAAGKV